MSALQRITEKVKELPQGEPFTGKEFIGLGSESNIRKVLERLVTENEIMRIRHGIYVRPKISRHVGPVTPSIEAIVKTIAFSTGEILQVSGAEAALQFGLSTQVPVKPTYLTSGRSRKISIGKLEIEFKKVSSKRLILAGTFAGLALTALWYIGKENLSLKTIEVIKNQLPAEEFAKLLERKSSMPSWMANIVASYEQQQKKTYSNEQSNLEYRKVS